MSCGGVKRYHSDKSSTYELVEEDGVYIEYGSGGLSGDWMRETVCLSTARACQGNYCSDACVTDLNMVGVYE